MIDATKEIEPQMVLDEAIQREIVSRIVGTACPNKIFLFGSAASGEMGPDSDIDLLVILQDAENPRQQSVRIRRLLRGIPFPFDILVRSQEQFEKFKDVVGSIFYTAIKHGRVLYG
ncbi:MAG: nucleotidyltransferase domain-containing protein [Candidatus Coatesbacteria bacterium]|nr:nucleotidyltransferase domain-containing protein [Candidatus Coatesbacteria bacterium]